MIPLGKVILTLGCLALVGYGFKLGTRSKRAVQVPNRIIELVSGYKSWAKANPQPVRLSARNDALCIASPNSIYDKPGNPHYNRYLTVYTNPTGEKAMKDGSIFPVGSVIVKEKRDGTFGSAIMSTVMIKREKGYNPDCGDWEFAAVDAEATKVDVEGKLAQCMSCHKDRPANDYVFRTYVGRSSLGKETLSGGTSFIEK